MTAQTLIRQASAAGVELRFIDGKVKASGNADSLARMVDQLRANKEELVEFLQAVHETTAALIEAAMRASDHHGDGEQARADMRQQCLETPPHLQADLLDYFKTTYGAKQ